MYGKYFYIGFVLTILMSAATLFLFYEVSRWFIVLMFFAIFITLWLANWAANKDWRDR